MTLPHLVKAAGLGAAMIALTAGAALAAVATTAVNVRSGPGTSYGVLDTLRPGEFVDVTGRNGTWCHVDKIGPNGWVKCSYLAANGRFADGDFFGMPSVRLGFGVRPMHPWWWYRPGITFNFGG